MAEKGIIPQKLAKVPHPKCPSCLYGNVHHKSWCTHKSDPKIKEAIIPGAVLSVDQLESPTTGFVPIAKGQPTLRHYHGVTVFMDCVSDFTYVDMNEALMTMETLEATHKPERIAKQHGIKIQHHHCDNGCVELWVISFLDIGCMFPLIAVDINELSYL